MRSDDRDSVGSGSSGYYADSEPAERRRPGDDSVLTELQLRLDHLLRQARLDLLGGFKERFATGREDSKYHVRHRKPVTPAASSTLTPLDMGLFTVISEAEETKDGERTAELIALARRLFAFAVAQRRSSSLPRAAGHAAIVKPPANNRATVADRGRKHLVQALGL